uniref:Uncharacterized protein n=1 Tax=Zea mays TaxID=4577 RepID=A0A804PJG0_MAIZE
MAFLVLASPSRSYLQRWLPSPPRGVFSIAAPCMIPLASVLDYSAMEVAAPSFPHLPPSVLRCRWFSGGVVYTAVPFYKRVLMVEGERLANVQTAVEVVEHVVEVTEKLAADAASSLLENGSLHKVAVEVECVAEAVDKDAHKVEAVIDKHKEKAWFSSSVKSRLQYLGPQPGIPVLDDEHVKGVHLDPLAGPVDAFCLLVLDPEKVR